MAREYNDLNFQDEDQLRSFFEGFSTVSAEALELMVNGRQDILFLNDVTELDDKSFGILSQIRHKGLELNGISEISKKQAECLSMGELYDLHLGIFNCEDPDIINLLMQGSAYDPFSIGINGRNLQTLRALKDYQGCLFLPSVSSLGIEESVIIKDFSCSQLTMHGLTEIEAQPLRNLLGMRMFQQDHGRLDIDNVLESNLNADAIKVLEQSDIDCFSIFYDGLGKKLRDGDFETRLHD